MDKVLSKTIINHNLHLNQVGAGMESDGRGGECEESMATKRETCRAVLGREEEPDMDELQQIRNIM